MTDDFPVVLFRRIPEPLLAWYDANARVLPWRGDPSPYHIWVSEIMLQQTRVEAVLPYYARFLAALPGIEDLAVADEGLLLKLWEGLGYYSRVRNLQKAARMILELHNGEFPREYKAICALPGIGDYAAGSISSIAFGFPEPAVDGNVLRVAARLAASPADVSKDSVRCAVRETLRAVYPAARAGDFTQSLMELGALVCLPGGRAHCEICPLEFLCRARAAGNTENLPVKALPKERTVVSRTVLILRSGEKFALVKRPEKGLLAGFWEFPSFDSVMTEKDISARLGGVSVKKGPSAVHKFSHIEWRMISFSAELPCESPEYVWFLRNDPPALPSAFRAFRAVAGIV